MSSRCRLRALAVRHPFGGESRARALRRPGRAPAAALAAALLATALLAAAPAPARAEFRVEGVFQYGPRHVGVAFSDSVDAASASQVARWTLSAGSTALAVKSVEVEANRRTAVLVTHPELPRGAALSVAASGVTSHTGEALAAGGPFAFATVADTVLGIAAVHARLAELAGRTVSVIAQVYVRATTGATPAAYAEDGTGRGLTLYGAPLQTAVDTLGHVVLARGTVVVSGTTVMLWPFTATVLAPRMPPPAPRALTAAQAARLAWEGTYVRASATLTSRAQRVGNLYFTWTASDGGADLVFRVRANAGVDSAAFGIGDVVNAAGAGGTASGVCQITIGQAADVGRGATPGDAEPPALRWAAGDGGTASVTAHFSEPLAASAAQPSHWTVTPTASPGSPLAVSSVAVAGAEVTLALAAPLAPATAYTVRASGVTDAAGVAIGADDEASFTATGSAAFEVTAAFPFGRDRVGVVFSARPDPVAAATASNYALSPSLAVAAARLQENGRTAILRTAADLPASTTYTVTVTGVPSATGDPLGNGLAGFTTPAGAITNIADIQANVPAHAGRTVAVIGQVFIPVGSRGGTPSGYIQDGSDRGLNIFGGSVQPVVNALGNVVLVSGLVEQYFATTEITTYTATPVATGVPHLGARLLTVPQANSAAWEGTYIACTARLTAITASGSSNYNYDATDAGANITFRVGNGLGLSPSSYAVGDTVTGRGAGGAFQSTFQIAVGNAADFFKVVAGGPDDVPPEPIAASGTGGTRAVAVTFSEPVEASSATDAANWEVGPAAGGAPLAVLAAALADDARTVTLALAAELATGTSYRVRVANVTDLAGNAVPAGSSVVFTALAPPPTAARLRVPARTLVKNQLGRGERFAFEIEGVAGTRALCRVFDLQGRLVRTLYDGFLAGTTSAALSWDARDESFELVPAGMYVVHLQTTDLDGTVTESRAPVVVAVRLE